MPAGVIHAFDVNRFLTALPVSASSLSDALMDPVHSPRAASGEVSMDFAADQPLELGKQFTLLPARTVDIGLTLTEARELMRDAQVDVLIGQRTTVPPFKRVFGVLTRSQLEEHTQNTH